MGQGRKTDGHRNNHCLQRRTLKYREAFIREFFNKAMTQEGERKGGREGGREERKEEREGERKGRKRGREKRKGGKRGREKRKGRLAHQTDSFRRIFQQSHDTDSNRNLAFEVLTAS